MNAEGMQQALQDVLEKELRCSELLQQCLETERSALTGRDLDALQQTTLDKTRHTGTLEQLETERERLITSLGHETDAAAIERCFSSLPNAAILRGLWQQILDNISACRSSNQANGGILEIGRQHAEQALGILRGQSGTPSLYDPHGETATNLGQRELGKV